MNAEAMIGYMSVAILLFCAAGASGFIVMVMWLFNASTEAKKPFKKIFKVTSLLAIASGVMMVMTTQ